MIKPSFNITYSNIVLSSLLVALILPLAQCGKRPSAVDLPVNAVNYPYPAPQNVPPTPTAAKVS